MRSPLGVAESSSKCMVHKFLEVAHYDLGDLARCQGCWSLGSKQCDICIIWRAYDPFVGPKVGDRFVRMRNFA